VVRYIIVIERRRGADSHLLRLQYEGDKVINMTMRSPTLTPKNAMPRSYTCGYFRNLLKQSPTA